jgi:hypothetical protein
MQDAWVFTTNVHWGSYSRGPLDHVWFVAPAGPTAEEDWQRFTLLTYPTNPAEAWSLTGFPMKPSGWASPTIDTEHYAALLSRLQIQVDGKVFRYRGGPSLASCAHRFQYPVELVVDGSG